MIIYIRHGDDMDPYATHRDDHKLSKKGRKKSRKRSKKLIKKYGMPKVIFCSPMERTVETLRQMMHGIKNKPKMYIDPKLSRYFCGLEQQDPSIYTDTYKRSPPLFENKNGFYERVRKQVDGLLDKRLANSKDIIWCITHALVMKSISKYLNFEIDEHVEFLDFFVLK